ncbi:hypothetical protein MRX96_015558 [Rhipicephalus microplus]
MADEARTSSQGLSITKIVTVVEARLYTCASRTDEASIFEACSKRCGKSGSMQAGVPGRVRNAGSLCSPSVCLDACPPPVLQAGCSPLLDSMWE